jgi:uroporphyrinogen-III decarboxylase
LNGITDIDHGQIELRKDRIRKTWNYQPVDHIPAGFFLDTYNRYSLREQCESGDLQYEVNCTNIDRLLRLLPDDYIPAARVWPGYMTLGTMYGMDIFWSDDPNQPPGVDGYIIDDMTAVYDLPVPDAVADGLMPFNIKWLSYFRDNLPPDVSLTGIDIGGPMNTAKDLLDTDLLYTAFYDSPREYHLLLDKVTNLQIECYREIVKAAGGIDRLTSIDFGPIWAPEDRKGFVSDDVCSTYSPEIFKEFSRPYNSRIFSHWPGGRIHNCGPHPAIDLYLDHSPAINGINCSYKYTRGELAEIKKAFKGRGIVEFMFDNGETIDEISAGYEEIANALAPDVVGIPMIWFGDDHTDDEIRETFDQLLKIGTEYAASMNWTDA